MRYLLLLSPLLLTGCLAFAAGAAGGAVASGSADDQIEYYIQTEGPPREIAEAMGKRELAVGMEPAAVRLVMDARTDFNARPDSVETTDDGERWLYENTDPMTPGVYEVTFREGAVAAFGYQ